MLTRMTIVVAAGLALAGFACDKNDNANQGTPSTNEKPVTPTNATVTTPATTQPPSDPLANAENKDRVKQYPDEVKMTPTPAKIVTGVSTIVRESPSGTTIAENETGMTVLEVTKRGDYYLVLYPDPKDASKQLAGWIYKDAVEAASWPGINTGTASNTGTTGAAGKTGTPAAPANAKTAAASKLNCKASEKQLRAGGGDFCGNTCKKDEDCTKSPGGLCDGVAYEVKKDGTLSSTMDRYCVLTSANVDRAATQGNTTGTSNAQSPSPNTKSNDTTRPKTQ